MKKLLIINHYAMPLKFGGWNRHFNLAKYLYEQGIMTTIIASSFLHHNNIDIIKQTDKGVYNEENVKFQFVKTTRYKGNRISRILNIFSFYFKSLRLAKKLMKESKFDYVFTSSAHPLNWVVGLRLKKKYKMKLISETRDLWPKTFISMKIIGEKHIISRILYFIEKKVYLKSDKLIFLMPGGIEYCQKYDIIPSKIKYLNNGVDLSQYHKQRLSNTYDDFIEKTGFRNIVYTGSLGIANNIELILQTAELCNQQNIRVLFHIFGNGYLFDKMTDYIRIHNLSNIIMYGKVDKKYIPDILSKAYINIFTSQNLDVYKYGYSLNKLFDYYASEKPIIANIRSKYDLIEKTGTGIVIKNDTAEDFIQAISKILNADKKTYEKYCENSLIQAKKYDFRSLSVELRKILEE